MHILSPCGSDFCEDCVCAWGGEGCTNCCRPTDLKIFCGRLLRPYGSDFHEEFWCVL